MERHMYKVHNRRVFNNILARHLKWFDKDLINQFKQEMFSQWESFHVHTDIAEVSVSLEKAKIQEYEQQY